MKLTWRRFIMHTYPIFGLHIDACTFKVDGGWMNSAASTSHLKVMVNPVVSLKLIVCSIARMEFPPSPGLFSVVALKYISTCIGHRHGLESIQLNKHTTVCQF